MRELGGSGAFLAVSVGVVSCWSLIIVRLFGFFKRELADYLVPGTEIWDKLWLLCNAESEGGMLDLLTNPEPIRL